MKTESMCVVWEGFGVCVCAWIMCVLRVYLWTVCVYFNQIIRVCTCGVRAKLTPAPVNAKVVQFQSSLATTQKISFSVSIFTRGVSLGHEKVANN
jgi:hypothetical protein